ncbi:MAG: hypothetical protein QOH44_602 [Actinomycetota bacterium]|nr:hypothetical protein [Actinomycetota bacterium]
MGSGRLFRRGGLGLGLREQFGELLAGGRTRLRRGDVRLGERGNYLVTLDPHARGSVHSDANAVTLDLKNGDDNVVPDEDPLSPLTCQDKHVFSLTHRVGPADG